MTNSTENITAEQVADLWAAVVENCYQEECSDRYAKCLNCGVQFKSHDEYDCEVDEVDEDDEDYNLDDWQGFEASTAAYLNREALADGTVTGALIEAYQATKDIPLDELPAYSTDDDRNPWRALEDCFQSEAIPEDADIETLTLARQWAEAWKNHEPATN